MLAAAGFEIVAVADLPLAHLPSSCAHFGRFMELEIAHSDEPESVVRALWHQSLTPEDYAACEYHQADWLAIADASIAVLESVADSKRDLVVACADQALPSDDLYWLMSLFADPIMWRRGGDGVENGQHRVCALRAAGAASVAVDTGG
jgi:hypothetical protein